MALPDKDDIAKMPSDDLKECLVASMNKLSHEFGIRHGAEWALAALPEEQAHQFQGNHIYPVKLPETGRRLRLDCLRELFHRTRPRPDEAQTWTQVSDRTLAVMYVERANERGGFMKCLATDLGKFWMTRGEKENLREVLATMGEGRFEYSAGFIECAIRVFSSSL